MHLLLTMHSRLTRRPALIAMLSLLMAGCAPGARAPVDLMNLFQAEVPNSGALEPVRKSLGVGGISYKRLQGFERTAFNVVAASDERSVKWFSSKCQSSGVAPSLHLGVATGAVPAAAAVKVDGNSFGTPLALVRYSSSTGETTSLGFVGTGNLVIPVEGSSAEEPPERRTACTVSATEFELAGLTSSAETTTVVMDGVAWKVVRPGREFMAKAEGVAAAELKAYAETLHAAFMGQGAVPWEREVFEEREKAGVLRVASKVVFRSAGGRRATIQLEAAATTPAHASLSVRLEDESVRAPELPTN